MTLNFAYIHLVINHIPVVALPLTTLFLFFAVYKKNMQMKKISLVVLIFIGLMTIPVYFTGQPAEHAIKTFPSVTEDVIEPHEEMAEKSLILILIASALAGAVIFYEKNEKRNQQLTYATLGISIFTSMALGYTAHLGGAVRHTEVRGSVFEAAPENK